MSDAADPEKMPVQRLCVSQVPVVKKDANGICSRIVLTYLTLEVLAAIMSLPHG